MTSTCTPTVQDASPKHCTSNRSPSRAQARLRTSPLGGITSGWWGSGGHAAEAGRGSGGSPPRTAPHPRACVQDGGEARGQGISREPGSRGSTSVRPPGPSCGAESAPAPRPPSRLPPSSAQAPAPRRPGRSFRGRPRGALRWGWRAPQESGPGRGMPVRSGAQVSARRGERAPGSTHGRGRTSPRSRAGGGKPVTGAGGLPRVCGS